jgi:ATP-dependent DNA helicase RecQ
VTRTRDGWESTGNGWTFDAAKYAALRAGRNHEAQLMREYAREESCLMQQLQNALDDPDPAPCRRCSVCTGQPVVGADRPDPERVEHALKWMRSDVRVIEPRKMWPSGVDGYRGKIAGAQAGRAIAFADDPAWPDVIAEVARRHAGPASIAGALAVLGQWRNEWEDRPTVIVALPGPDGGRYAIELAAAIGSAGKLPVADILTWSGSPLDGDSSSATTLRALTTKLSIEPGARISGTVLLVAATSRTGWTTTLAAALLRSAGATHVLPLVAHQLP